jgi:hypothetical protein
MICEEARRPQTNSRAEDFRFGTFAVCFGRFVILQMPLQIPGSSVDSPGRHGSVTIIRNGETLLDILSLANILMWAENSLFCDFPSRTFEYTRELDQKSFH